MFLRKELLAQAQQELDRIKTALQDLSILVCVGLPIEDEAGRLFNCAAYVHNGEIVGIVPKTYIPNYGEFYEKRWFASAQDLRDCEVRYAGHKVKLTPDVQIFQTFDGVQFGVEICEDVWAPAPPSNKLALAGADLIFNLSASDELIGKHHYLKSLLSQQSARSMT